MNKSDIYIYIYTHIFHIYIYIYTYTFSHTNNASNNSNDNTSSNSNNNSRNNNDDNSNNNTSNNSNPTTLRPIPLLRLSLLTLLDSNFEEYALWDMRIPPLNFKILLDPNPLKSSILVRRLVVLRAQVLSYNL